VAMHHLYERINTHCCRLIVICCRQTK